MIKLITKDSGNISLNEVGGKALNLFKLQSYGLQVPHFVVIPQSELISILPQNKNLSSYDNIEEIKKSIAAVQLTPEQIDHILQQFKFESAEKMYFSVRSSATDEDGSEFSFAGQFESFLYVSPEYLAQKIKEVWLSTLSDRILTYRKKNNIPLNIGIAVIIQQMINSEVSGVAFGMNPTSGSRSEKVISSVYGLGEGIVSGELNADTYIISKNNIEEKLVKKEHALTHHISAGGCIKTKVEKNKQELPSLNKEQLKEISGVLDKLKKNLGKPQDIEFAYENNTFYLLQARPVTNLNKVADADGQFIVWDNSNIIESYPGVTTPLTFSFIIKLYEAVYKQFSMLMGVKQKEIEDNQQTFANMLGLINGRVYYNLLNWYRMLQLFPGYSVNAEFMEKMMGVKEKFDLPQDNKKSKFSAYIDIVSMIIQILGNLISLPKQRDQFLQDLDQIMENYNQVDFDNCRPDELMQHYFNLETTLLKKWKAPLVNDFFAMIYFGTLQKLITKYKISDSPLLCNDLLCGNKDIISTEPIERLLNISTLICKSKDAHKFFTSTSPEKIWESVQKNTYPEISSQIKSYIHKFGERCVGELKLETISYKQDPFILINTIKAYAEQNITNESKSNNTELKLRSEAEKVVKKALKNKPVKKRFFNYWLKTTRQLVSNRENLRYERTRAFGIARSIFSALGKQFYTENIINNERDIFYLTKEEIFQFIQGTSPNQDLKKLIQLRKDEFLTYNSLSPTSERIRTRGMVYQGNDFFATQKKSGLKGSDLKGLGCCPGQVTAKIRVVINPREVSSLNGDILVTANTDPGWVTLFPTASAIIVERGSLLSHSAIVSREMGIPCIVGVTDLLHTVKTGDIVSMDGSTGEIKIIKHATAERRTTEKC